MSPYYSCNCKWCKGSPTKIKYEHKKLAHRVFRRKSKRAIQKEDYSLPLVSTGYKY